MYVKKSTWGREDSTCKGPGALCVRGRMRSRWGWKRASGEKASEGSRDPIAKDYAPLTYFFLIGIETATY